MKTIKGFYSGRKSILGRVSCKRLPLLSRRHAILVTEQPRVADFGYAGIVTTSAQTNAVSVFTSPLLRVESLAPFQNGDVVLLEENAAFFLWEVANRNNCLLLTEACNCHCLMCPQPPKPYDSRTIFDALRVIKLSPPGFAGEICLTGGEPTLCGDKLLLALTACHRRQPKANLIMLTNGKRFSEFAFTKRFALLNIPLTVAVSLHADVDTLHDDIVGAKGSFYLTQKGLYNLAKLKQHIEIRVVISKMNCARLPQIARYIYRNFPFAEHVTFMGLEVQGAALHNFQRIWVDPPLYMDGLEEALHELHRAGINVSTYNHPLCLLPRTIWSFARQSISDWKNSYLPVCEKCQVRARCCGLFATSGDHVSSNIHPVEDVPYPSA